MHNELVSHGRVESTVIFTHLTQTDAQDGVLARHEGAGVVETAPPFEAALTQWWQTYGRKYRVVIACEHHEAASAFALARAERVHAVEIVDRRGAQLAIHPFAGVDALQRHLPDVCVADCAVEANERAERAARAAAPLVPLRYSIEEVVERLVAANPHIDARSLTEFLHRYLGRLRERACATRSIPVAQVGVERIAWSLDESLLSHMRENRGIYIIATPTGSGKTQFARALVQQAKADDCQPVYVSRLRSIVRPMADLMAYYQPERVGQPVPAPGEEVALSSLAVTGNSLGARRYKGLIDRSQTLIVDEAQQVLEHLATADNIDNREQAIDALGEAIRTTSTVVLCDADANGALVDFVKQHRPDEPITVITGEPEFSHIAAQIGDFDQVFGEVMEAVKADEPVRICADSAKEVRAIAARIHEESGCTCLAITGHNSGETAPARLIAHPDAVVTQWSVLVHSPAIVSSVSITVPHFTRTFGLFSGVVTAAEALQMLRRDRTAQNYRIGVRPPKRYHLDCPRKRLAELLPENREASANEALIATIRAEQSFSRNHLAVSLWAIMEAQGITVSRLAANEQRRQCGREAGRSGRRMAKAEYDNALLAARAATDQEWAAAHKGEDTSEALFYRLERRRVEHWLGRADVTPADVALWAQGCLPSWVQAWRIAGMTTAQAHAADRAEKGDALSRDHIGKLHAIFCYLLDALGWRLDGDPTAMVLNRANAGPVLRGLVEQYLGWIQALDLPVTLYPKHAHAKSPVPILRRILETLFGLMFRDGEMKVDGKRTRGKRVEAERLQQLRAVVAIHGPMTAPQSRCANPTPASVLEPETPHQEMEFVAPEPVSPELFWEPILDSIWGARDTPNAASPTNGTR